jgi:hypothetical protein
VILSITAFLLAILSLTTVIIGQVHIRRERAAFATLQHALAARARRNGDTDEAWIRETIADFPTHKVWPFRPRPAAEFEIPAGIVTINQHVTGQEYETLKARWEEQLGQHDATVHQVQPTSPRPRTRRWWRW